MWHICMSVLVTFPAAIIKYSNESNLREKRSIFAHVSRVQYIMMMKAGNHELETAGSIASIVRKKRVMAAAATFPFFIQFKTQPIK